MQRIYPWLIPVWGRFRARWDNLPHAILVRGRPGLGKGDFCRAVAQALLCESPREDRSACGACAPCAWFAQGNHPDFRLVEPDAISVSARAPADEGEAESGKGAKQPSRQIRIEQIRALQDFLAVGTHRGGRRVVLLRPAEAMNAATANALLKSLEEPPPGTIFILVSSNPERLLPTVRSRCQAIEVPVPPPSAAEAWLREQGVPDPSAALAFAGNAPLDALDSGASGAQLIAPALGEGRGWLEAVDALEDAEPAAVIDALQKWIFDALAVRLNGKARYHPGQERLLAGLAGADAAALHRYARRLAAARRVASHPLNPRLFLEDLVLELDRLGGLAHG